LNHSPKAAALLQDRDSAVNSQAITKLATIPLAFEPNQGQMDGKVQYAAKASSYTLFLTASQAVFTLPEHLELPSSIKSITVNTAAKQTSGPSIWNSIAMRMVGARSMMAFSATDQLPGKKNYYIGTDKTRWAAGVPLYSRVQTADVYPGIDMAFRTVNREFEFDFLVHPGADPRQIKLAFSGAQHIKVDTAGDLVLSSRAGDLQIHRPFAYQEMPDGGRSPVAIHFTKHRNGEIQLAVGAYDRQRPLIVDPSVIYATYLGGVAQDMGLGVTIDSSGNTYVTGGTASPNFPNTDGGLPYSGGLDVFVTEFDSLGQLVFSTLVGGTANDVGTSIAVTGGGIFVTGYTNSNDFPVITNFCYALAACMPVQLLTNCGTQNAFVFTLSPSGVFNVLASAYLGGSNTDTGLAITADTAYGEDYGYIYIAGQTTSPDFATCNTLFNESQINMGHGAGPSDGFVAKISQTYSIAWFSTFLGGSNQDFASGIALDNPSSTETNVYVTGGTNSPNFYTTPGVIQPTCGTDGQCNGGNDDAFVTAICTYQDAPCSAQGLTPNYVYSTFLGGSGKDDAYSIAADTSSNAYITGQTSSTDFKLQTPFQATLNGTQNAFVSKLGPGGSSPVFSTYLGGSQTDAGLGLTIDDNDNVYVTGRTDSPDFPTQSPTQGTIGGGYDAFISAFSPSGTALTFSTFLGGSGNEDVLGGSIAVDSAQNVYVTGDTNSTDFPTQNPYQSSLGSTENCDINGNEVLCPDAFVAKLNVPPPGSSLLTVTIPSGPEGIVNSNPQGISQCSNGSDPGVCSAEFLDGTRVTLTATPVEDQFGGWSGDAPPSCGTNPTCVITITGNTNVIATFSQVVGQLYSLLVQGQGINGEIGTGTITSSPAGINCGTGGQVCMFDFAPGTPVTLTATPDPGSFFDGWSQTPPNPACSGTGQCTVLMTSNQTVDYTFLPNNAPPPLPDFTITIAPQNLGSVPIGGQGVADIAIATLNGFTDTVNLSCSVLPASTSSPSCSVTPSSLAIPVNGAGSATLAVNTTGLTAANQRHRAVVLSLWLPFLGLPGAGASLPNSPRARKWLRVLVSIVLLVILAFQLACGGSGGVGPVGGVAQAGNYTVVVNAEGQSTLITHSAQVTITVQ
jgi:hypothetical protein